MVTTLDGPAFPSDLIGCDGECGFERRGSGWKCVEGTGCGRLIQRGEPGYEEIGAYYAYWSQSDDSRKLRVKYASSKEVGQTTLRARDYVLDETTIANAVILTWAHDNNLSGLLRVNSKVMRDLRSRIAKSIKAAYEKGKNE